MKSDLYTFSKYAEGKHATWAVNTPDGDLLCVCLYKKGARNLCDHINAILGHIPVAAFADRRVREEIKLRYADAERAFKEHYKALVAKGVL